MKPVLILQHLSADGPAYLGNWLAARGLPFDVFNTEARQVLPATLAGYGALAILGCAMSANDDLPALRQAECLVREALAQGVPTLGHWLGAQLMARALGERRGRALRASAPPPQRSGSRGDAGQDRAAPGRALGVGRPHLRVLDRAGAVALTVRISYRATVFILRDSKTLQCSKIRHMGECHFVF